MAGQSKTCKQIKQKLTSPVMMECLLWNFGSCSEKPPSGRHIIFGRLGNLEPRDFGIKNLPALTPIEPVCHDCSLASALICYGNSFPSGPSKLLSILNASTIKLYLKEAKSIFSLSKILNK